MRIRLLYNLETFMKQETSPILPGNTTGKAVNDRLNGKSPNEISAKQIPVELPEGQKTTVTDSFAAKWINLLIAKSKTNSPIVTRQELLAICIADGKPNDIDSLRSRATRTNDLARRAILKAGFTIKTVEKPNRWDKDGKDNGSYRFIKQESKQSETQTEEADQAQPNFQPDRRTDPYGLYDGAPAFVILLERLRKEATSSPEPVSPKR